MTGIRRFTSRNNKDIGPPWQGSKPTSGEARERQRETAGRWKSWPPENNAPGNRTNGIIISPGARGSSETEVSSSDKRLVAPSGKMVT